jgi:hypothetical protein
MLSFIGRWAAAHQTINTVICWDYFRYASQAVVLKCCKIQKGHCSKIEPLWPHVRIDFLHSSSVYKHISKLGETFFIHHI